MTIQPPSKHDPYAAFRNRTYRLYVGGWFLAMFGTRIQTVAIGWEMYQRTGEALALGLVGLVLAVPTMLLALPAGYLADRFERRRLVMLSLLGMTMTSFALAGLSFIQGPVWMMYAVLFLDATAVMVGRPARSALLPQLIPRDIFPNAVTWNTSLMQIASVFGPALGGFIIAVSVPSAYVLCALSSLIFVVMLARMEVRPALKPVGHASMQTLAAGLRFIGRTRLILVIISLDLFAVLLGGAVYLLPIFAEDILQIGATGFGWLQAAPAVGAFCMALSLAFLPPMKRAGRNLLWAVAGFGLATIVFGLSKSFWLSWGMLFLTGAFDNVSMVIRHTLLQLLTPDHMRGRVSAVNSVFVGASNELGGLESGVVAHFFGPVASVVSGGIGTLLVVGSTIFLYRPLLEFGSLDNVQPVEYAEARQPLAEASVKAGD